MDCSSIFLIIVLLINPSWAIIFLTGFSLYALISAEAQVLQALSQYRNIPRFIPFLLSLFPIVIFHQISQLQVPLPQFFYFFSSVLAFLISYSTQYNRGKSIIYQKAPPIWFGLLFIAMSGVIYYLESYKTTVVLVLELFFYTVGALVIYMSIGERLRQEGEY